MGKGGLGKVTHLWYEEADKLKVSLKVKNEYSTPSKDIILEAGKILDSVEPEYARSEDQSFATKMINRGTTSDQISAMCVLVQDQPVLNREYLIRLLKFCSKKSRSVSADACQATMQVFLSHLLPLDRKLFRLGHPESLIGIAGKSKHALLWAAFEDWLKLRFIELISYLKVLLKDSVEHIRLKSMKILFNCLDTAPEGESSILTMLCNKLGDPVGKVSGSASHQILKFMDTNPGISPIVVSEIQKMLLREHNQKAHYNCVVFLSQVRFGDLNEDICNNLVNLYLGIFEKHTKETQMNPKLISAILTGINRAFPYISKDGSKGFKTYLNSIYSIVHHGNWGATVQALSLLLHIALLEGCEGEYWNRFYNALYAVLMNPEVIRSLCASSSSKLALFLNTLYRALKADNMDNRRLAIIKRLLQLSMLQKPQFICSVLFLISNVLKEAPELKVYINSAIQVTEDNKGNEYDPMKRDSRYTNAELVNVWELSTLLWHYHPSVKKFVEFLMNGEDIVYNGDPLTDFSIMSFLDGFVFKNPKNAKKQNMDNFDRGFSYKKGAIQSSVSISRPEDVFFHKYFAIVDKSNNKESFGTEELFADALFEQELNKADGDDLGSGDDDNDIPFADSEEDDMNEDVNDEDPSSSVFADADSLGLLLEKAASKKAEKLEKWQQSKLNNKRSRPYSNKRHSAKKSK